MPHVPGHNPNEQEKIIICGLLAAWATGGAIALLEALSRPWPGRPETILEVIVERFPVEAQEIGPAITAFCEAGEVIGAVLKPLLFEMLGTDRNT